MYSLQLLGEVSKNEMAAELAGDQGLEQEPLNVSQLENGDGFDTLKKAEKQHSKRGFLVEAKTGEMKNYIEKGLYIE